MKILVPVDFSEASLNAATYAAHLADELGDATIYLFHVFAPTNIGSDGSPVAGNDQAAFQHISGLIQQVQLALHQNTPSVPTEQRVAVGDFATEFKHLLKLEDYDIIVMGMTQISKFEEKLLGSNVLDIIDAYKKPVFVITNGVEYRPINKAALAADLNHDTKNINFDALASLLNRLRAELDLVSIVDDANVELDSDQTQHLHDFETRLSSLHPSHTMLEKDKFSRALNNYAETNEIDLLVVLPRKQNFFRRLFGLSQSTKLYFSGNLPILALRH